MGFIYPQVTTALVAYQARVLQNKNQGGNLKTERSFPWEMLLMEEILLMDSLSHHLQGFCTSQVVVWDFWTIACLVETIKTLTGLCCSDDEMRNECLFSLPNDEEMGNKGKTDKKLAYYRIGLSTNQIENRPFAPQRSRILSFPPFFSCFCC